MARFVTGKTFGTTETVTAALLNQAVNDAAISTDSVDNSTIEVNSNALRLKDSGITTAKIADSSSKTTGVTFAKMQHISTAKVLGRASASEGDVEEAFDFKDEDDMSSNSATALSSQQSIKAYVDSITIGVNQTWQSMASSRSASTSYQNTTGKPIMVAIKNDNLGAGKQVQLSTDNFSSNSVQLGSQGGVENSHYYFIVPNNHYYKYTGSFALWVELR